MQKSTNLTDWENVFTNHSATTPFIWSDPDAGNVGSHFYRVQVSQ
ncbi:MAG TPA: hypothetical protein VHG71_03540 [Verrucomicrobiae bacterium]|nr:hypothetical protein [Verrucomicrobiae bacterium]